MEIYVKKFFYFHIFSFFLVFNHDFVIYIHFTHIAGSNAATLMTSQFRSDIEYLIQTHNIFVLILYSKLMRNVAALAVFFIRFNDDLVSGLLFWATL